MVIAAAIIALLVAAALAGLISLCGPVDAPGPRRSHVVPIPTSGGLAILAATCVGLALIPASDPRPGWLALAAALLGLLGAADDMLDLPASGKLLVQIALALQVTMRLARVDALPLAPGMIVPLGIGLSVLGSSLWLVVLTNAVNFMDGADGLAPGAVVIALFGLALAAALKSQPGLAAAALVGATAGMGFLPWNLPAHRLFQGDAGALFSGLWLGGLALVAAKPTQGASLSPYLIPFAALPLLTDVLLTLAARAWVGKPLFSAHRDHLYQRWLDANGGSHVALSLRFWLITAAFTAAGVANEAAPLDWRGAGFAAGVVVAIAGWIRIDRRVRRAVTRAG